MREVAFVIPSLDRPHLKICLEYLGPRKGPVRVVTDGESWPKAVNIGLADVKGRDVVLMDDDVIISPRTFQFMDELYDKADIFGFKLWFPDGTLQHAGGLLDDGTMIRHRFYKMPDNGQAEKPCYLPHVTTSLCYIKAKVIESLGGFSEDYPGMQFEDVDFCFRAIKAGFKILYTPGPAIHMESFSKKHLPMFNIQCTKNLLELHKRHLNDPAFLEVLKGFPRPLTA